jgi:hypothetical protein
MGRLGGLAQPSSFLCESCAQDFYYVNGALECFKCHEGPFCYKCVQEHREECDG